jgi:hypothetical protein
MSTLRHRNAHCVLAPPFSSALSSASGPAPRRRKGGGGACVCVCVCVCVDTGRRQGRRALHSVHRNEGSVVDSSGTVSVSAPPTAPGYGAPGRPSSASAQSPSPPRTWYGPGGARTQTTSSPPTSAAPTPPTTGCLPAKTPPARALPHTISIRVSMSRFSDMVVPMGSLRRIKPSTVSTDSSTSRRTSPSTARRLSACRHKKRATPSYTHTHTHMRTY